MNRRYLAALVAMTLVLALAAFVLMWLCPQSFQPVMPWMALYFGGVTAVLHWVVTRAMRRSPRAFVQVFLGSTVGMLVLHLALIGLYLMTHYSHGGPYLKAFLLAFLVGFVVSFAFETTAMVRLVDRLRRTKQH